MKKYIALFLTLALTAVLFAGCAGTPVVYYTNCTCPAGGTAPQQPTVDVGEGSVKTGLAILTSVAKSKEGAAEYDVTIVAVTVNDEGIITDCVIDSVGTTVAFGTDGVITSDLNAEILTKNELGDAYNMKTYGGAIAEWYEQAASFCSYITGKTPAEVAGIAVDETTKPTDADLLTSVTIKIGEFQNLIAKACG